MKIKMQFPLRSTYCALFHRVLLGGVDRKSRLDGVSVSESAHSEGALPQNVQIMAYSAQAGMPGSYGANVHSTSGLAGLDRCGYLSAIRCPQPSQLHKH